MADTQSIISDVKLFLERLKKELPEGSPLIPDYTGMVLFSALSMVLSIFSCCA